MQTDAALKTKFETILPHLDEHTARFQRADYPALQCTHALLLDKCPIGLLAWTFQPSLNIHLYPRFAHVAV